MGLAGFCRNCFSKWYAAEAAKRGIEIDKMAAREMVYGMPYNEWTDKYQTPATDEQMKHFNIEKPAASRERKKRPPGKTNGPSLGRKRPKWAVDLPVKAAPRTKDVCICPAMQCGIAQSVIYDVYAMHS